VIYVIDEEQYLIYKRSNYQLLMKNMTIKWMINTRTMINDDKVKTTKMIKRMKTKDNNYNNYNNKDNNDDK